MKVLGIVRRVDDLGRIAIPKEFRKIMKIREGDSLELYLSDDNRYIMIAKECEDEFGCLERAIEDFSDINGASVLTMNMKKELLSVVKKYKEIGESYKVSDGGSK